MDRRSFFASFVLPAVASVRTGFASDLHSAVDSAMSGRQGSALVVDVQSGKLMAQHRIEAAARRLVPPGSVIKPFTLAALIEANIVQSTSRLKCGRTLRINGHTLDCSHIETGEALDPVSALAYSCNSYFAQSVLRLHPPVLAQTLMSFGLTASTKFAQSEITGRIAPPGTVAELQLLALGESGIAVTPLEIAAAYRRIALMKRENNHEAQQLSLVFQGLSAAAEYGTARLATPPSGNIAGKTGTATVQPGSRPHAWFAGYSPADRPEFVVVIFLETGSGGGDAAPIARRVFAAL